MENCVMDGMDVPAKEEANLVDTKGGTEASSSNLLVKDIMKDEDIKKEEDIMGDVDKENEGSNKNSESLSMEAKEEETGDCLPIDTKQPSDNYMMIDPVCLTNSPMAVDRMMKDEILRKIAGALAGNDTEDDYPETNFCIEDKLAPEDIEICVKNVGKLQFPLDRNCIEKLNAVSSDAKFGLGESTIVDKTFRNTQVIESQYLDVNISPNALLNIIDKVHHTLNLPVNSILKPHLHNMLIYSPGQFFGEHRDSEKMDKMVATLVVVLPSPHIGGKLVIKHSDLKYKFTSENLEDTNAKWICFFSDCWHEVKKIKCGHRVVLTYNVLLEHGKLIDISVQNKYLEDCLRTYFNDKEQKTSLKTTCKKLVILLNHSYSEHSLKWNLLKGEDLQYARLVCSAAKRLNLMCHLGLVSISQQWTSNEYNVDPMDFIDSTETVEYWVDENNRKLPYDNYSVPMREVCFTKETEYMTFTPVREDFTGPTGNEGATVDYWYKRAAIVLWLQSDSVKAQFELNYQNAMNDLCKLVTAPGNETRVKDVLQQVGTLVGSIKHYKNFSKFAQLALYIKDENSAFTLLSKLGGNVINSDNSLLLVELQKLYGTCWFNKLIVALMQESPMDFKQILPFINNFVLLGGDQSIMQTFLEAAVMSFIGQKYTWNWQPKVPELLKACILMKNPPLVEKLIKFLISHPISFLKDDLILIYLELKKLPECSGKLELLRVYLVESLKKNIAEIQSAGEWSISWALTCGCDACKIAKTFLISNERVMKISKVGNIRRHLASKRLPVIISDEGKGKNVFLVLTKSKRIYDEATAKHVKLNTLLTLLQQKPDTRKRILEQPGTSTDGMKSLKQSK